MDLTAANVTTRPQERIWAAQLGRLSAELPTDGPSAAISRTGQPVGAGRLPAILEHFRHRQRVMEHSDAKFRAHEFILAP